MKESPDLSIVVPVLDEEANIAPLVAAVREALGERWRWEMIIVDDGSTDGTVVRVRAASARDRRVRLVGLARNYGQSTAMQAGFDRSRGGVIVTMDGDLQNDPRDIPVLLSTLDEGFDLVAGYRVDRKDRLLSRRIPSWLANRLVNLLTGVGIRDAGCSLKAYRRELLQRMRLYSDMHRFIPALAVGTAGARIAEVPVRHHPRRHGTSKYGLSRVVKVLSDLLTIKMIRSFRSHPLELSGSVALVSMSAGLVFGALALVEGLSGGFAESRIVFMGVSLVLMALGVFLLLLGLIAEAVVAEHDRGIRRTGFLVHEVP